MHSQYTVSPQVHCHKVFLSEITHRLLPWEWVPVGTEGHGKVLTAPRPFSPRLSPGAISSETVWLEQVK